VEGKIPSLDEDTGEYHTVCSDSYDNGNDDDVGDGGGGINDIDLFMMIMVMMMMMIFPYQSFIYLFIYAHLLVMHQSILGNSNEWEFTLRTTSNTLGSIKTNSVINKSNVSMPKNNSFHITRVRSMSEKNASGGMDIDRSRSYSSVNYNNNNELLNREGVIYNNNSSHSYSINNNNNSGSSSNSYNKKNRNSSRNSNNDNKLNHSSSSSSEIIIKKSSYSSSFESPFTSDGIDNIHRRDNSNNSLDLHSGGGSGIIHSGGGGDGGGGGERGSVGGISLASALMTPVNSPSERRNINKQMLHQMKMQNANLLSRYYDDVDDDNNDNDDDDDDIMI
jgi:uncharacterized membrane protein YgcG